MYGKLHLIGSPIGNSLDVSLRLRNAFINAKYICVEDIDRFKEYCIINNFIHNAELIDICFSLNNNREVNVKDRIIEILKGGEDVYIISDEGMPGLADPGNIIVESAIVNKIEIYTTPGPSTVIAAASIANILNNFLFEGFMSNLDDKRYDRFKFLQTSTSPMIFLLHNPNQRPKDKEDKIHMIHNCFDHNVFINELIENFSGDRKSVFCINLTTENQKVIRGTLNDIKNYIENNFITGNLCIVVDGLNNNMSI